MKRPEKKPEASLWILGVLGLVLLGVSFGMSADLEPATKTGMLAFSCFLIGWALLGIWNLTGFQFDPNPTLRVRRDSIGEWEVRLVPSRFLGGQFVFGRTAAEKTIHQLKQLDSVHHQVLFRRRGRQDGVTYHYMAPFPFGNGSWGFKILPVRVNVLPRQVPANLLNLPRLTSEFDRARLLRGSRDGAYKGIAEYGVEHTLKEVNWKASARTGQLVVNEFEGVLPSRKVLVAPDPKGSKEGFEHILDFTYSLLEILHNDWQVYLYCFDGTIFHLPRNSLFAVEDYFLDLYPLGNRPDPGLEFPGLKIFVTATKSGFGPYHQKRWRIVQAFDIAPMLQVDPEKEQPAS